MGEAEDRVLINSKTGSRIEGRRAEGEVARGKGSEEFAVCRELPEPLLVLQPEERLKFNPREDITIYDLALIFKAMDICFSPPGQLNEVETKRLLRHFAVEEKP